MVNRSRGSASNRSTRTNHRNINEAASTSNASTAAEPSTSAVNGKPNGKKRKARATPVLEEEDSDDETQGAEGKDDVHKAPTPKGKTNKNKRRKSSHQIKVEDEAQDEQMKAEEAETSETLKAESPDPALAVKVEAHDDEEKEEGPVSILEKMTPEERKKAKGKGKAVNLPKQEKIKSKAKATVVTAVAAFDESAAELARMKKELEYKASIIESQMNLLTSMSNNVKCAICFDTFKSPRSLSCGHVFCSPCLWRLFYPAPGDHHGGNHGVQTSDDEILGRMMHSDSDPHSGSDSEDEELSSSSSSDNDSDIIIPSAVSASASTRRRNRSSAPSRSSRATTSGAGDTIVGTHAGQSGRATGFRNRREADEAWDTARDVFDRMAAEHGIEDASGRRRAREGEVSTATTRGRIGGPSRFVEIEEDGDGGAEEEEEEEEGGGGEVEGVDEEDVRQARLARFAKSEAPPAAVVNGTTTSSTENVANIFDHDDDIEIIVPAPAPPIAAPAPAPAPPIRRGKRAQHLNCPTCRKKIDSPPMNVVSLSDIVSQIREAETSGVMAGGSPPNHGAPGVHGETGLRPEEENDETWGGIWPKGRKTPSAVRDRDDGVVRCGHCNWEIDVDSGVCNNCEREWSLDRSDDDGFLFGGFGGGRGVESDDAASDDDESLDSEDERFIDDAEEEEDEEEDQDTDEAEDDVHVREERQEEEEGARRGRRHHPRPHSDSDSDSSIHEPSVETDSEPHSSDEGLGPGDMVLRRIERRFGYLPSMSDVEDTLAERKRQRTARTIISDSELEEDEEFEESEDGSKDSDDSSDSSEEEKEERRGVKQKRARRHSGEDLGDRTASDEDAVEELEIDSEEGEWSSSENEERRLRR